MMKVDYQADSLIHIIFTLHYSHRHTHTLINNDGAQWHVSKNIYHMLIYLPNETEDLTKGSGAVCVSVSVSACV